MSFVSYAQNQEDVMLWRALGEYSPGFYIDVGAHDPSIDSITKAFYEKGWFGVNIEPLKNCFDKICCDRIRDINLNIAIDSSRSEREFYEIEGSNGLSTLITKYADNHARHVNFKIKKYVVQTTTLAEICHDLVEKEQVIHFLKIDVEGSEKAVLESADFKNYRPWIIVVEATEPLTKIPSFSDWEPILLHAKYFFVYFDGLNRFYIAKEKLKSLQHHFFSPPNIFDDYARYKDIVLLENIQNQLKDTTNHLDALLRSCSWRYTAPMRKFFSQATTIKKRFLKQTTEASAKLVSQLNQKINSLKNKLLQVESTYRSLSSNLKKRKQWFLVGLKAWLSFAPGCRPERMLKKILLICKNYVIRKPWLKSLILSYFPCFKLMLRPIESFLGARNTGVSLPRQQTSLSQELSPRAQEIYTKLAAHFLGE